jgi:hypothetical protein
MNYSKPIVFILCACLTSVVFANNLALSPTDITNMVRFLTSDTDIGAGVTYQGTARSLSGLMLPMSYYSTPEYWAKYVCAIPGNNCVVEDTMGSDPGNQWSLGPISSKPGGDLQYERVNVFNGVNIYDAATWQIAMALAAKNNVPGASFALANNENDLLSYGYDGNAATAALNANRGNVDPFVYNQTLGKSIPPLNAYFFRMITRNWLSVDPFIKNSAYLKEFVVINPSTPLPSGYQAGNVTWADWKPITGENAWAFLIGPLQAAFLQYGSAAKIPLNAPAVQNALNVLTSFRTMQSHIGAIYYGPDGMFGNTGGKINPYEVSTENNASILAGLLMLQEVLTAKGQTNNIIHTMIYGDGVSTAGILSFFKNNAWDPVNHTFYQGGFADQPGQPEWKPTTEPQAVDVNTWTVTVLGQPLIDSWFGAGMANTIWENVKSWGGFFGPDNTLWGVGYSSQDGNGGGKFNSHGILSVEWTVGAINMVKALMSQYGSDSRVYANLQKDFDSMTTHVMSLRTDKYAQNAQAFPQGISSSLNSLVPIPDDKLAFLYASKRYSIPFGWYANPLPSTCSTAWILMQYYNFNPFTLGGGYAANFPVT